jgi:hypothetical protein
MACFCSIRLCECIPAEWDIEEYWLAPIELGQHFNHVHWTYASSPPLVGVNWGNPLSDPDADLRAALLRAFPGVAQTYVSIQEAFRRIWEETQEAQQHVLDFYAEMHKRQRALAVSQRRSPDHGPPCPPTPYRSDMRTVHRGRAARPRTRARR